ncbi:aminoacyl-histidine dipeptidase [Porticoccus sp. W117]|uniref:aminoacyl-histidine dipeptidase n=1 Tax=Porticoccus sp. W117 TaxID=3054777 RepID=UPI002594EC82|nr:aminoacyl-histidine dipeptidase [Porticoccus sp. W117]MDM3872197.1 aminoacyl-histidine dipeptidase [Porticoccus sp. W117]
MNQPVAQLQPTELWNHFQELCNRPRPSKEEQAVVDYVLEFAARNNLENQVDGVGNVIVRKPATAGMEDRRGVILQSHLDMVPQKNAASSHNFSTDPISAYIEGDWVTADGTTLGADNGIGCAAMLAVLESTDIAHGPIEALFTIDEEAGMTGAQGLQPGILQGDILLNLDSEDEGELFVGCAGGVDVNIKLPYVSEPVPAESVAFELNVGGLVGGHSGLNINDGRGNANKITNRLLSTAVERFGVGVYQFNGGTLRNAIPREAFTGITVAADQADAFTAWVEEFAAVVATELAGVEDSFAITLTPAELPEKQISKDHLVGFIQAVYACPNGATRMISSLPGVVETSNNLAVVFNDDNNIYVQCLTRSASDTARDDLAESVASGFRLAGADVHTAGAYPGWTPKMDTELLTMMVARHKALFDYEPKVSVIHAGLECGILGAIYPNWDMISFGPTIRGAHSPDEKVSIPAVASFWQYLKGALAEIPKV